MSLPAASAPVAVLVLAWDETTPAVRALVEAAENPAPALDSVVVLVPAGPATAELTPEEFLPLEASIDLPLAAAPATAPAEVQPAAEPPAPETATAASGPASQDAAVPADAPAPAPESGLIAPLAAAAPAASAALPRLAFADVLAALPAAVPTAPAVAEPMQGVRVLRLSTYSLASLAASAQQALPAPAWVGAASFPVAPYLGGIAVVADISPVAEAFLGLAAPGAALMPALALPGAAPALGPWQTLASAQDSAGILLGYLPAEPAAAPDAEPDTAPTPAATDTVPAAETSTTELDEAAADELTDTLTVDVTPAQADWSDALASLQKPAAVAGAAQPTAALVQPTTDTHFGETATEVAAPELPASPALALLPAAHKFDAPNLNFQIIQYARFAVPLALAEPPFDVIYAPAWPTWLAAQELRHRTGQPLVLHVATLAAAEDEPIDLAAGWVAEIQRQALHRADLILTETPALAARLRHELALPAHRVRPVPAADAAAVALALRTVRPSPASL